MVINNNLRIGITGSTGVLGKALIQTLSKTGVQINCLIRKSSDISMIPDNARIYYGDLFNMSVIRKFIEDSDICLHLAAQVSYTKSEIYEAVNVKGTNNICTAIIKHNPSCRLIYCSSIAAYRIKGICKMQFTDYAKSKLKANKLVWHYYRTHDLRATIIVPGLIYGPGKNVLVSTIINMLQNKKLFFVSGGEKNAPVSYIDDLCDLFLKAIGNDKAIGHTYFGINYTKQGIHDFINMIAQSMSYPIITQVYNKKWLMTKAILLQILHILFHIKDSPKLSIRLVDILSINYTFSDEEKENNLGWKPKTSMQDGIKIALKSYKSTQK